MLHHRLLALVASTSLAALATPVFAQTAATVVAQNTPTAAQNTSAPPVGQPTSTVTTMQEIVVTAEKRSERISQVPMGITAVQGVTLDKLQERSFEDYAATIPGLSLTSDGPGVTRLTLRGLNAGGVGSTVATYVDESPFGSSTALVNGSILTGDFDTFDLQRIEVLHGPQGTLYGANSEGGLLKFVTNAPRLGAFNSAVEVSGEDVDHAGGGGSLDAMINVPIGEKVAFRVVGFEQYLPGYIDDPSIGELGINSAHKDGGRASLLLQPTDKFSIRLTAFAQEILRSGSSYEDVNAVTLAPAYGDLIQSRGVNDKNDFKYQNYNATVSWDLGLLNLLSTTTYGVLDTKSLSDETAVFGAPIDEQNNSHLGRFTQEVRLTSAPSDRFEWLVGGYYTSERGYLQQALNFITSSSGTIAPGGAGVETVYLPSSYREYAGFGDVTVHFTKQFDVQLGGRYASNQQDAVENVGGPLVPPPGLHFETPSKNDVFTYSVAPRWQIDPNTLIYARVATGFRPGGPNVLPPGVPTTGVGAVPHQYSSDSTTNYEVGFRSALFQRRLSIDIVPFYIDWRNIQLFELINNFGINGNGGSARSQGVEYTVGLVPLRGLNFTLAGAYTDAVLTSAATGVNAAKGDRLPYVPKWSDALDGEYDWDSFADYQALVGGTVSYVGKRSTDFSVTSPITVPSYTKVDLRVGIQNRRWLVELYAKNVTDKRGIVNYLSSAPSSNVPNGYGSVSIIQPRTIGILLSAKF
jgi:outer membrane receptor protein involved in Fe transport